VNCPRSFYVWCPPRFEHKQHNHSAIATFILRRNSFLFFFNIRNTCSPHDQFRAFEAQLKLAAKWLKPIVIHSRGAYEKTFELMKQVNNDSEINPIIHDSIFSLVS
jgi:Tat protein secretion system quality control protein TatD with DNase activity